MKLTHLPLIVLSVGVLLVAISFILPHMIGEVLWSDEQAREHDRAGVDLHKLSHEHGHAARHGSGGEGEHEAQLLEEARQRYKGSEAELQQARSRRQGTARILKWTGVVCSFLGAAGYFLLRSAAG